MWGSSIYVYLCYWSMFSLLRTEYQFIGARCYTISLHQKYPVKWVVNPAQSSVRNMYRIPYSFIPWSSSLAFLSWIRLSNYGNLIKMFIKKQKRSLRERKHDMLTSILRCCLCFISPSNLSHKLILSLILHVHHYITHILRAFNS